MLKLELCVPENLVYRFDFPLFSPQTKKIGIFSGHPKHLRNFCFSNNQYVKRIA